MTILNAHKAKRSLTRKSMLRALMTILNAHKAKRNAQDVLQPRLGQHWHSYPILHQDQYLHSTNIITYASEISDLGSNEDLFDLDFHLNKMHTFF